MSKLLTQRFVDAVRPGVVRREIPDGGFPGLYLVVQAAPSATMSWAYRYRSPVDARPKKLTIGRLEVIGLSAARKAAAVAALAVAEGRDPSAEKKTARAAAAERSDLIDQLLDEFVQRHIRPKLKPSTAAEMERLINRELRPRWGRRKIGSLSRRDVIELLDAIVARGASITANRVLALVRKFGNWLTERAVIESSPASSVKAPSAERSRDRVLSDQEIVWLWKATEGGGALRTAVRLLLLTGQRRNEVGGMQWAELNLHDECWSLPPIRTKNSTAHLVPLAPVVVEAIRTLPRVKNSKFVFSVNGTSPISGWSKLKLALDKRMLEAAKVDAELRGHDPAVVTIDDWTIHDLRRTCASGLARLGQPVHVTEAVLNHKSGSISGVAAIYNRYDYASEKRKALIAWSEHVLRIAHGATMDNVVGLRDARA